MGTPMFASIELAARIDQAEARLSRSIGQAVLANKSQPDAFVEEIGGGVAVYAGPASPMNKMIGVGFVTMPSDEQLQAIEEKFASRCAPLQAEVSTLANPALAARLTRRGYILQGFENVLGRPIGSGDGSVHLDRAIEVGVMQQTEGARWLEVMVTSFLSPDQQGVQAEPLPPREFLERALRDSTDVAGFRRYCAQIDGQLAGVAALRLDDRLAQLCGAATLPDFRRRGVQTALLRRRLADGFHNGCELALMTTQPGSKSQQNGYKQGFTLLYSRALLVKHPN
jgi:ribosomal protein S18 acetylase RimI-like enzyme